MFISNVLLDIFKFSYGGTFAQRTYTVKISSIYKVSTTTHATDVACVTAKRPMLRRNKNNHWNRVFELYCDSHITWNFVDLKIFMKAFS